MVSRTFICFLLLFCYLANAIKERDVYVKLGDDIQLCCELNQEENQAIVLYKGNQRLRSLVRSPKYKQIDANSQKFFSTHLGFSINDTVEPVKSLCVEKHNPGAITDDDNMEFLCELIEEMGLGSVSDAEKITIRIYELPVVSPLPSVLESVVNGPLSIKCVASGRPNLKLRWLDGATNSVYVEWKAPFSSDGKSELALNLEKVTADQDGQKLICEAYTSYPLDSRVDRQSTVISVSYPPQILFETKTIHTALGESENIVITVQGNPKADLICDNMDLFGSRQLEALPDEKLGVNRYVLHLHSVTQEDLGSHFCSATNRLGTVRENITLTVAPSKPRVISPGLSNNADYYLLGWQATSKLPPKNVTFHIKTLNDKETQHGTKETRTVMLNDTTVGKVNTSSRELHEFWHHLANLTFGSEHQLHIHACNELACNDLDLQLPDITFRTMTDHGTNKIDPEILARPPSAALRAAAFRDFNGENDSAFAKSFVSHVVMLVAAFVIDL